MYNGGRGALALKRMAAVMGKGNGVDHNDHNDHNSRSGPLELEGMAAARDKSCGVDHNSRRGLLALQGTTAARDKGGGVDNNDHNSRSGPLALEGTAAARGKSCSVNNNDHNGRRGPLVLQGTMAAGDKGSGVNDSDHDGGWRGRSVRSFLPRTLGNNLFPKQVRGMPQWSVSVPARCNTPNRFGTVNMEDNVYIKRS